MVHEGVPTHKIQNSPSNVVNPRRESILNSLKIAEIQSFLRERTSRQSSTLVYQITCSTMSSFLCVRRPQYRHSVIFHAERSPNVNKLGVHALVFTGLWDEASCRRAVSGAGRSGYELIEIPILEPEGVDSDMTRAVLEEHGLSASTSLGLHPAADISSEDASCCAKGKELLLNALQVTDDIGSDMMCGVLYSAIHKYPGPPTKQGRRNCIQALQEVATAAADKGIHLNLEAVNRYESNVVNTALQAIELVDEIGRNNVFVHLDSYHCHIEEASQESAVQTCLSRGLLGYVHVGESQRGYLGSGSVDFRGLFKALVAGGYLGPITFESFSSRVVSPALSNNLCIWRDLWEDSDDVAEKSIAFIKSELKTAQSWHAQ